MQGFGWMRSAVGLLLILLCCQGCAAGPAATGAKADEAKGAKPAGAGDASSEAGLKPRTDCISDLMVDDRPGEIVVRIKGNGPFQDYEFRRQGENGFSLQLLDVHSTLKTPVLQPPSQQLSLSFEDEQVSGQGIQLVGMLTRPLDHYVVNAAGNDLFLVLYPGPESTARTTAPAPVVSPAKPGPKNAVGPSKTRQVARRPAPKASSASTEADNATDTPLGGPLQKKYSGTPISLDLLDADLKNVLRLIADVTGTNIVIEPDVSGRVTLKVEQVPWDQVLDMILSMNDLGMERRDKVVRIAKKQKLNDEYVVATKALKDKQALLEAAKDVGEVTTAYLTVNYASAAEIAAKISEIKSEKGKISVDERTSMILYSDYPARIENARQLLGRLDRAMAQVLIEARVAQVKVSASRDLGIKWNVNTGSNAASSTTNPWVNWQVDHYVPSAANNANIFGFTYGQVIGKALWNIDLTLSALESASKGKIIAAPRVLTLNNVKAVISKGSEIPYLQASQATPISGGSAATGGIASTEYKKAVLELAVTPHITPDRKVRMEVNVKKDSPSGVTRYDQTIIDTRNISTELLVEDGNTIVIGGVLDETVSDSVESTPYISKIPILGAFFKKTTASKDKEEMLIFICPRIIDASAITRAD